MEAVASTMIFPGLSIRADEKKFDQPLEGFASWVFNDFIKFSRINISVIPTNQAGHGCILKNSTETYCDGIYGQLQRCETDFSLFALGIDVFDSLIETLPVFTGPQTESTRMAFLGYNCTAESKATSLGITKLNISVYALLLFILLSLVGLNALSLYIKKKYPPLVCNQFRRSKLKPFTWRPGPLLVSGPKQNKKGLVKKIVASLNLAKSPQSFFLFSILFMLSSSLIIGVIETNSILTEPPKYFSNIFEAIRNKTYKIVTVKGLSTGIQHFKDPEVNSVVDSDRIIGFESVQLMDLARKLEFNAKDHFNIGNYVIAKVVKAFICSDWIAQNGFHSDNTSPTFLRMFEYFESPSVAMYSHCIKENVRRRLDTMFHRWTQSYIWSHYMEGAAFRVPVIDEQKVLLCIKNAPPFEPQTYHDYKKEVDNDQPMMLLSFVIILTTGFILSVLFLFFENALYCTHMHCKKKRLERIRRFSRRPTRVHWSRNAINPLMH